MKIMIYLTYYTAKAALVIIIHNNINFQGGWRWNEIVLLLCNNTFGNIFFFFFFASIIIIVYNVLNILWQYEYDDGHNFFNNKDKSTRFIHLAASNDFRTSYGLTSYLHNNTIRMMLPYLNNNNKNDATISFEQH